jgi:hypothetical protein
MRMRMMVSAATLVAVLSSSQVFAQPPVVVACGAGQHTVVRNALVRGEQVTRIECVGSRYQTVRYRAARPHRSWGKSALVIGGSAATGAGIGGIIHGKKGALIGAALGGGAGSLFEATKRR